MAPYTIGDLTFVHIPRNAGASITVWLNRVYFYKYSNNNPENYMAQLNPRDFTHTPLDQIEGVRDSCAVVRNPWERVVSMWAFSFKRIMDFDHFVRNLDKFKPLPDTWFTCATPQKAWISGGVTHLLKYESLEEDFKTIQTYFDFTEPLPKTNKSAHDNYKTYYTQETWDIVAQVFSEDIAAFGYNDTLVDA